jgi:hypothetical protein
MDSGPDEVVLEIVIFDVQSQPLIEENVIWGYLVQIGMAVFEKPVWIPNKQ